MAPINHSSESSESINSDPAHNFFQRVDSKGFPAPQQKEQPWTKFINATTNSKKPTQDERMTVICGLRHDYGEKPHHDLLSLHLTFARELRARWLLT